MKRYSPIRTIAVLLAAIMLAFAPASVFAEGEEPEELLFPGVIITELQTGLGTGQTDKEFIELYNATDQLIQLGGWQLWYAPEPRTALEPYRTVVLADGIALEPAAHLVLASDGYTPNQVVPVQTFEKMLSAEGGNVVLLAPVAATCQLAIQDAFAWGGGLLGAGDPAVSSSKTKDKVLARTLTPMGYSNTRNNAQDFVASSFSGSTSAVSYLGTPGDQNTEPASDIGVTPAAPGLDFAQPVTDPDCELEEEDPVQQPPKTTNPISEPPATIVPATSNDPKEAGPVFPERSKGLASPHITELLPNPASPQTDAADEFVELYNSNDAVFELTGFKLVSGKRSYVFPADTLIAPKSFAAYHSADTRLALSNSGGRVQLLDPFGNVIGSSEAYGTAKDGQSWALANGAWHWTTSPTPKAANVIHAPVAASKKKSTASKTSTSAQSVKGASSAASANTPTLEQTASTAPSTPIHTAMLALVGVFALLYGIYEYRGDLANKLYQFRAYRAARRSLRQKPEGRGSN